MPQILNRRAFSWASLKLLFQPFEINQANIKGGPVLDDSIGRGVDCLVDNFVDFFDNLADVGPLPVLLQALVYDVDGVAIGPVSVDAPHIDTEFELLEHLAGHHFEPLTGLVVLVGRLLAGDDGCIPSKAALLDDVVKGCASIYQERPRQGDGLGQIVQQVFIRPGRMCPTALTSGPGAGKGSQCLS